MKLTLTLSDESYKSMVDDNLFVDKSVWVAKSRTNKELLRDGEITSEEVVIHVTVDEIYFANDVLRLSKQGIPDND